MHWCWGLPGKLKSCTQGRPPPCHFGARRAPKWSAPPGHVVFTTDCCTGVGDCQETWANLAQTAGVGWLGAGRRAARIPGIHIYIYIHIFVCFALPWGAAAPQTPRLTLGFYRFPRPHCWGAAAHQTHGGTCRGLLPPPNPQPLPTLSSPRQVPRPTLS